MTRSTYLVTGGAGFLGINLCRFLLSRGHVVRSLDIAPFDYPERDRVDAILGDGKVGLILNIDSLVRLQPDRLPLAA